MIGYLEGKIIHTETDRILLQAGSIGYEVVINAQVLETIRQDYNADDHIPLYIYYHQTERQPKPVLLGFVSLMDKEFFQLFITVDAIGPLKAVKALDRPVNEVASAIESKDVAFLSSLSGIGKRSAEKIIAQLHGKVEKFLIPVDGALEKTEMPSEFISRNVFEQVLDVLVGQLGHSPVQAKMMIEQACHKRPDIKTPEALFDAIFKEDSV